MTQLFSVIWYNLPICLSVLNWFVSIIEILVIKLFSVCMIEILITEHKLINQYSLNWYHTPLWVILWHVAMQRQIMIDFQP